MLGAAMAAPAVAQPVQFSAVAEGAIGYGTNPFLASGVTEGAMFASARIDPRLYYQTARSSTALQGHYSRETYLHDLGHTDSGSIGLVRTDQLTQYLGSTLSASYLTTNRATISDPNQVEVDPLNIGRRTRTFAASYHLQWQANARDQWSYSAQVSHLSYGKNHTAGLAGIASIYTQYGVNAGYNHVVDARTTVGAQISLSSSSSRIYPHSRTVQPAVTAKRQLSVAWEIDGHVGMVFSRIEGPFPKSTTSLGIGINLCGTYPLAQLCLKLNRDTQPSGYGPLRTMTSIAADISRKLDEHSRISLNAEYVRNSSGSFTLLGTPVSRDGKMIIVSSDYDRDITQRISAGFGGKYEWREFSGVPSARSYAGTIHVRAKLGRM
jgi:hypothetical protein